MFDIFIEVLSVFFNFLKIPIFIIGFILALLFVFVLIHYAFYRFIKKMPRLRSSAIKTKKKPFLFKIFVDFPRQLAYDIVTKDPDRFPFKGVIIFTGRQGNGKTIALVNAIHSMQSSFPRCKVITNLRYTNEDDSLHHWRQLCDYTNSKYGVIVGMDETQNWFSSAQSRNFPPEMLSVITQNRKNARIILGTAQSFHLLSKSIRSQCTEVRECHTFFGCVTYVTRKEPILDPDGNVSEYKRLGSPYFFVHSQKLRNMYDTYFTVDSLCKSGFVENKSEL